MFWLTLLTYYNICAALLNTSFILSFKIIFVFFECSLYLYKVHLSYPSITPSLQLLPSPPLYIHSCSCLLFNHNSYELMHWITMPHLEIRISEISFLSAAPTFFLLPLLWLPLFIGWWEVDIDEKTQLRDQVLTHYTLTIYEFLYQPLSTTKASLNKVHRRTKLWV